MFREEEINFVKKIVKDFGVDSCFDNIDEDNPLEEEGLWFYCPICDEPIFIGEDWTFDEVKDCYCPVCEENFYA